VRPSVRPTRQPKGAIVIVEAGSNYRRICFWFIVVVCEREREIKKSGK